MEKEKHKTRWRLFITILVIIIIVAGGSYYFILSVLPSLIDSGGTQYQRSDELSNQGEEKINDLKIFGDPIKNNEATGRKDPFAPI